MADGSAGLGTGHRSAAGIGEQVQHPNGTVSLADLVHDKIPVHRLLREQARMLEVHGLDLEGQILIMHLPAFRQRLFLPVSAAGLTAEIPGVGPFPLRQTPGRFPDGLWVRTHQILLVPALQLFTAAAVQQLIILPLIRDPHRWFLLHVPRSTEGHTFSL